MDMQGEFVTEKRLVLSYIEYIMCICTLQQEQLQILVEKEQKGKIWIHDLCMASVISDLRKPSHNFNARFGNKEGSHAVLKNKLMLQDAGEEMLEDAGMQSLADSVASTLREKIICAMSLIKRCQEMTNKETGFSNQFNFFLQKRKISIL